LGLLQESPGGEFVSRLRVLYFSTLPSNHFRFVLKMIYLHHPLLPPFYRLARLLSPSCWSLFGCAILVCWIVTVRANSAIGAISSITTLPLAGSPTQENVDSDSENPVAVFHTEDVSTALTAEIIQSRRAAIDAAQGVSDEIKAQLRQQLDRSADFLNQKLKIEQRLASVKAEVDSGPAEISALRKTLEQPGLAVDIQLPVDAGVAELEKLRATDQEQLAEVTGKLESWETRAKNRSERRPQMPALIESARAELEAANEGLLAIKTVESQTPETVAARTEKEALVELKRTELEMLRAEQARYEALSDLFPLQRDDLTRSRNSLERRLEQWDSPDIA
jgi:hypothetical protein